MTSKYPRLAIVEIYNPKTKKTDKQYMQSDPDATPPINEISETEYFKLLNQQKKEYNNECSIK